MPVQRTEPAVEQAIVADYKQWRDHGLGSTQEIWSRYGVSKQTAYNILRRNGVIQKRDTTRPVPGLTEVTKAYLDLIKELREWNAQLTAENTKLKHQLVRSRAS